MKAAFSISLKNRLALTYTLFITVALAVLCFVINLFSGIFFTTLVKENIAERNLEITALIADKYNPFSMNFDVPAVETIGMYFAQAGYIVTLENSKGDHVWDARSCDMECCVNAIASIAFRMEGSFNMPGELRKDEYPIIHGSQIVGNVIIETYGPFFYSETEARFLKSLNTLMLVAGIIFAVISIIISLVFSRTIARPILSATEAAQRIAQIHTGSAPRLPVKISEDYKTRELVALSSSINTLAQKLEESERRKKQLTSDIAHELRTPLTCLLGAVEAMIDGVYEASPERLENCREEIVRLANLVQDLDTLTSLEWETITLVKTEFDLAKLLQTTVEQWRPTAAEKGIAIELSASELMVSADYDRLKQVFINILSNAVKYTDSGSVTLTAEASPSGGQGIVSIADTGIGIAQEELPHIFERFYRTDKSRSRSTGGAGIGLAIAAAIVRAHGGSIFAKSNETGTVFTIEL